MKQIAAWRAALYAGDASAGWRERHPDGAGITGPQGREHDDDLHACAEQAGDRGEESAGLNAESGLRGEKAEAVVEDNGWNKPPAGLNVAGLNVAGYRPVLGTGCAVSWVESDSCPSAWMTSPMFTCAPGSCTMETHTAATSRHAPPSMTSEMGLL